MLFCKKGILRNFPKFTGKHICTHSATHSSERFKPLSVVELICQGYCWIGKKHKQGIQLYYAYGACNQTK